MFLWTTIKPQKISQHPNLEYKFIAMSMAVIMTDSDLSDQCKVFDVLYIPMLRYQLSNKNPSQLMLMKSSGNSIILFKESHA